MDPIIGGAIITGAGSLLGSVFSGLGSSSSASKSLQATRETNAQNYQIWQEQKAYDHHMWNLQNDYNDPSAQVERLRNSGLNPYLALQNGASTGMATSAPGSGQAPTMQTPGPEAFQSPWTAIFDGLARGVISFGQAYSNVTNASTNKAVGDSQIGLNNSQIGLNKANTEMTLLNKDWAPKLWQEDYNLKKKQNSSEEIRLKYLDEGLRLDNAIKNASLVGLNLSNEHQMILNHWLPQEKQIGFMTSVQEFSNKILEGKLTEKNIEKAEKDIEMYAYNKLLIMSQVGVNKAQEGLLQAQELTEDAKYWNIRLDNQEKQYKLNSSIPVEQAKSLAKEIARNTIQQQITSRNESWYENEIRDAFGWFIEPLKYATDVINPLRGLKLK